MTRSRAVLALALYGAALGLWAATRIAPFGAPPLGRLWSGGSLAGGLAGLAGFVLGAAALFVPVGLLAVFAVRKGRPAGPLRGLLAWAVAVGLTAVVLLLWPGRGWRVLDAVSLTLGTAGSTGGVLAAVAWTRGPRARTRFLVSFTAACALVVVLAGLLARLAFEPQPLALSAGPITSAEKRRIYYRVVAANPRTVRQGETRTLRFTARDLDVLASWAQAITGPHARISVGLGSGSVALSTSLPVGSGAGRYLNAVVEVRPAVAGGRLALDMPRLRLGRLQVPRPILAMASPLLAAAIRYDERLHPFIAATHDLRIKPTGLAVRYGRVEAPPGYVADVVGPGLTGEVDPEAVRAHVQRLIRDSRQISPGEHAVPEALRTTFAFAQDRSREGSAVLENKAGLLALGILLGHWRLQTLVGRMVEPQEWRAIGPALRSPRLRGRNDWTRHFFVSAGLTVLSKESVSDAAGLFKEELDADGGSGFSFADLLADRAGTCFALAATRDEEAARATQQRLAAGVRTEDLLPAAGGLPEGLTDAELERDYGGVGGAAYRRLAEAIEGLLPGCQGS